LGVAHRAGNRSDGVRGQAASGDEPDGHSVKAVLPSDVRVKLIGGGPNHAVLRVETYDRDKKYWVPKTVLANPGEPIDGTGWSLNSLTMNTFTLAAEATDDAGVVRKLTTRN